MRREKMFRLISALRTAGDFIASAQQDFLRSFSYLITAKRNVQEKYLSGNVSLEETKRKV